MGFNRHSHLEGKHALLSASKYHWVNYDEEKLDRWVRLQLNAAYGSRLHALAHMLIGLGQKLPDTEQTLNMYVNDALGFRMDSEVILFYSDFAFGTADTISFRNNKLRIHDLKNGGSRVSFKQLEVYAALFCLEYGKSPVEIEIELRIYQNDQIAKMVGDPVTIATIMSKIRVFSDRIAQVREEEMA